MNEEQIGRLLTSPMHLSNTRQPLRVGRNARDCRRAGVMS